MNRETRRLAPSRSQPEPRHRPLAGLAHRLIYSPRNGRPPATRTDGLPAAPEHLAPVRPAPLYLSTALEFYVFFVIVAGFLMLGFMWWNRLVNESFVLISILLVAVTASLWGAHFSPRHGLLALNFAFAFMTLVMLGTPEAMLVAAASGAAGHLRARELVYPGLFRGAVFALTMALGGFIHVALGGTPGDFRLATEWLPLSVALAGAYAAYTVALVTAFTLAGEGPLLWLWRKHFWAMTPSLLLAAAAVVMYVSVREIAPPSAMVVMLPFLLLVFFTVHDHSRHIQKHLRVVTQAHHQMQSLYWSSLESLAGAIDAKDPHSHGPRLGRLVRYAEEIGRDLGLSHDELQGIRTATLLHDIGKLGVPDHLLHKSGPLTPDEERRVREHPEIGARILEAVTFPWPVAGIVRAHHERFDGSGYPDGLKGEDIPLGARILAVTDSYNELTGPQPEHPPLGADAARAQVLERSGTAFDPRVVAAFDRVWTTLEPELQRAEGLRHIQQGAGRPQSAGFRDIAEANRELLALYELAQTIGSSLTTEETVTVVLGKLKRILDFTTAVLYVQTDDNRLVARGVEGEFSDEFLGRELGPDSGVSFQAFRSGEAQLADDPGLEGDFHPEAGNRFSSVLAAPMTGNDGRVLGTLTLYDRHPGFFNLDYLRLLNIIAHQAAVALENARLFEETRTSAMTDPLTGLPNARYLALHLDQELAVCRRTNRPLALLYLDLDNFKPINDTFGHRAGDLVLQRVGHLLKSQMREYDIITRYAGDEFIAVLRETGRAAAEDAAYRIKGAVRQLDLGLERTADLGVSVGIAYYPQDGTTMRELIDAADAAMYRDKRQRHAARS